MQLTQLNSKHRIRNFSRHFVVSRIQDAIYATTDQGLQYLSLPVLWEESSEQAITLEFPCLSSHPQNDGFNGVSHPNANPPWIEAQACVALIL